MRTIYWPLLFLLVFVQDINAQEFSEGTLWILKISPTEALSPRTPTLGFSVESRVNSKIGLEMDFGFPVKNLIFDNSELINHRYFKTRIKVNLYKKDNRYFGMYAFLVPQKFERSSDWLRNSMGVHNYDYAHGFYNRFGLAFLVGKRSYLGDNFSVEVISSIGMQIKQLIFKNITGIREGKIHYAEDLFWKSYRTTGTRLAPYFNFGIRLGIQRSFCNKSH